MSLAREELKAYTYISVLDNHVFTNLGVLVDYAVP